MKTFKTLEQIKKFEVQQVTAQQLLNGRMYLKNKGWNNIKLTDELKEVIINSIVEILGGQRKTKEIIYRKLHNEKPQHWGLDRIFISQYKKHPARLSYCAGQDYTWEVREIRNAIK